MNVAAFLNTVSTRVRSLPIVILYVTEGCNMQCAMCSYRDPRPNEMSLPEIRELAGVLASNGLQHIVYSGGEPLLRKDFHRICEIFSSLNVRQTLLTNGLLLEKRNNIVPHLTELIVSIDGPTPSVHDSIRGVQSFDRILRGIQTVCGVSPRPSITIRTVVQKKNYRYLDEMVGLARRLRVDGISFLAADVLSDAFGRRSDSPPSIDVALDDHDLSQFRNQIESVVSNQKPDFDSGFIAESPAKLRHIADYFGALLGQSRFPRNFCNAPMVSAVITSAGDILPCFFLPSIGNIRTRTLGDILNSDTAVAVRQNVRAYRLDRCKTCVCTLHTSPLKALAGKI